MSGYRIISIIVLILLQWLSGCSTISYYSQSIQGHLEIMRKRVPIDTLLVNQTLPPDILAQLAEVKGIRDFASVELGLPENNSYREYADIKRDYVAWNVFATPELSLKSRQWCYLFIGCVSYRGYFTKDAASRYATSLEKKGYDVFTGGVTAYSTLGWFDDPVLNTMLRLNRVLLARTIFHELAHQKLYVKNDTKFNEAFADTVAAAGVKKWLDTRGTPAEKQAYNATKIHEDAFVNLVIQYRDRLEIMYASGLDDAEKRKRKYALLEEMKGAYQRLGATQDDDTYAAWFADRPNNANLVSVTIYRDYLPGFDKLLSACGDNLIRFYELVEQLRGCSKERRRNILLSGQTAFSC